MADVSGSNVRRRKRPSSVPVAKSSEAVLPQEASPPPFQLRPSVAFFVLFASHVVAAFYHPIQDCDEVFNFYEPSHYLNHGHGFQTWEYSPVYAIRSWAYAGLHAVFVTPGKLLAFGTETKTAEFYFLRIVLGLFCASCETRLFTRIAAVLNPRIAVTFLLIMATSPGMFHASISYLPSSFTMYTTMLGMAAFMDWRGGVRTAQGIFAIGAGAVLGWPFAAAMALPFLLEEVMLASISDRQSLLDLVWRFLDGGVRVLLVLVSQTAVDSFFYKKLVVVPFNIVWYNVFSGNGGPDLYGTESWHFYLRNLFLNFHLWLPLALLSMPLLIAQHFLRTKGNLKTSYLRGLVFLSPFYLWLAIFTLQPHKEERFMYPAYPALALNAAVALHILLANSGSTDPRRVVVSKIPIQLRFVTILGFVFACLALSAFRTLGTMTAYNAPLSMYKPLHRPGLAQQGDTFCLGKEWYRFPSHYLLPDSMRAKFIKSEFSGLLPGQFHAGDSGQSGQDFRFFPGAYLEPSGMNDQNREDLGKYTDIKHCNFLVDSFLPSMEITKLEPHYIADEEHWERVKCLPFLDATSTGIVGRLGWIPDLPFVPKKFRQVYGEYCLLKRKTKRPVVEGRVAPVPNIEIFG
ncbi:mannosyltransferase [Vermiconidia calcicola]|uniref:Mannosyltransferase n=1 Tax=Vermiconidia calcicola TaxID=1690605 RepID=A0ACC3MB13_9PEZI|nr:mannosyltransferase [Vermiconidia calcicola]